MKQRSRLILIIYTTQPGRHAWPHIHNHSTSHTHIQIHNSGLTSRMNTGQSISSSDIKTIGPSALFFTSDFQSLCSQARIVVGWFCPICHGGRLLKNDIIACSNWRIKMLLQNMWKKSFKILFFFFFLNCFFSPLLLCFLFQPPSPPQKFGRWGGGKRPRVLDAPCTLCILDTLLTGVRTLKCQIGCVQVQVWLCECWFGCGFVTPQRSRRSPPQLSAASHKVCRKTRREGCLSD